MEWTYQGECLIESLGDVRDKRTAVRQSEERELDSLAALPTDGNVPEEEMRFSTLQDTQSPGEGRVVCGANRSALNPVIWIDVFEPRTSRG